MLYYNNNKKELLFDYGIILCFNESNSAKYYTDYNANA